MLITIAGEPGSGKSTVGKLLAQRLGYQYLASGALQRELAAAKGMDTLALNQFSEQHRFIDDMLDDRLRALADCDDNLVIDARLGWHFIPKSFKIYLRIDVKVAAARVMAQQREDERYQDLNTAISALSKRLDSENNRFYKLYNVRCNALEQYDLVINSSQYSATEIVANVLKQLPDMP